MSPLSRAVSCIPRALFPESQDRARYESGVALHTYIERLFRFAVSSFAFKLSGFLSGIGSL